MIAISMLVLLIVIYIYMLINLKEKKYVSIFILIITIVFIGIHLFELFSTGNFIVGSDSELYVNHAKLMVTNLNNSRPIFEGIYLQRKSYYIFNTIIMLGYIFSNNDYIATIYNELVYILVINIFLSYILKRVNQSKYLIPIMCILVIGCSYSAIIYSRDIYIIIIITMLLLKTKDLIENKEKKNIIKIISLVILLEYFRENFGTMYLVCLTVMCIKQNMKFGIFSKLIIPIFITVYIVLFPMMFDEFVFENSYGFNNGIISIIVTFIGTLLSQNPFKNIIYWIINLNTSSWISTNIQYICNIAIGYIVVFINYKYIFINIIKGIKFNFIEILSILYGSIIYLTYSMSFNVQQRIQIAVMIPIAIIFLINRSKVDMSKSINIQNINIQYQINIILMAYCILDYIVKVIPKIL